MEYAKQLVYDLIAEKEMQAFNRGGRMGGNGGPGRPDDMGQEFPNLGGGEWIEVYIKYFCFEYSERIFIPLYFSNIFE